jgi:hypothetical protein
MLIGRRVVLVLRVFLALLFALLLMLQTLSLPGQFAYMAEQDPDQAYLRWPLTIVAVLLVGCAQVVVVATWRLLTLVERDEIFQEQAFPWVDAIVGAIGAGWLLVVGLTGFVGLRADDPGPVVVMVLLSTGVTVLGLLMLVMRALLRRATTLRADMEAVI